MASEPSNAALQHVDRHAPSDIDAELIGWLAEAYEIGRRKNAK